MQKKTVSLFFEISYASCIKSYRDLGFEGWNAVAGPQVSPPLDQSFFFLSGLLSPFAKLRTYFLSCDPLC